MPPEPGLTGTAVLRRDAGLGALLEARQAPGAAPLPTDNPEALAARAESLGRRGPGAALDLYREALRRAPHRLGWRLPVAKLALELGRVELAIEAAERVLRKHPGQTEASILLASALLRRRDFTRMAAVLRRIRKPGTQAGNIANLTGTMLAQQGRNGEALAAMRPIKSLAPRSATLQMSRLMYLNYDPELSRAELFREHRSFGAAFAGTVAPLSQHLDRDRDPGRRLRIGYLSPDFRTHSVAYFMAPIFEAFDREQFDVVAYAHVAKPDAVTERLRGLASE